VNQKKNDLTTVKEQGFTLVEVIVAVAILSFAIFATLRVITASLNSITRQAQRVKALHLAQAHLAKLEAESFSKVVPETWVIGVGGADWYQLSIYDPSHPLLAVNQFIDSDSTYWYLSPPDGLGFDDDGQNDGILIVSADGNSGYTRRTASTNETVGPGTVGTLDYMDYNWDIDDLKLFFDLGDEDEGKEVQIYYRYYHLVQEGGTVPSSGEEGLKEGTIKLITSVGDTNGNETPGEKTDILGDDLYENEPLSPSDYESFDSQTRELTFIDTRQEHPVRIYYLPDSDTDSSGPGGAPDGYLDPTENSIVGVAAGNFCYPDGSPSREITNIKEIIVTEYWKQGKDIQSTEQETYITK